MKSNFRFYFLLIIWGGVALSMMYGVASHLLIQYSGYTTFAMFVLVGVALGGMIRNIQIEKP